MPNKSDSQDQGEITVAIEKIKVKDVAVGDRISLDGVNKPAFTVTKVVPGMKILGLINATRIEVVNDAGLGVGKNLGVNKPLKRETN